MSGSVSLVAGLALSRAVNRFAGIRETNENAAEVPAAQDFDESVSSSRSAASETDVFGNSFLTC